MHRHRRGLVGEPRGIIRKRMHIDTETKKDVAMSTLLKGARDGSEVDDLGGGQTKHRAGEIGTLDIVHGRASCRVPLLMTVSISCNCC